MPIIKPFHTTMFTCADCEQSVEVIMFDGVKNWEMKFSEDVFTDQDEVIVSIVRVTMKTAETFMRWAAHEGIHTSHRLVLWAKDTAVYDRLVELARNPQELVEDGEQIEEDNEEAATKH